MSEDEPACWSVKLDELFDNSILRPVNGDRRTRWEADPASDKQWFYPLGVRDSTVRTDVIFLGRSDFTVGWRAPDGVELTAKDKVLLYCFFNLRQHFYSSARAFEAWRSDLVLFFRDQTATMIDIGCGPAISALALSEAQLGGFEYVGVDRAPAMLEMARSLCKAAGVSGLFHSSWKDVEVVLRSVIVNFSFLFASDSIEPQLDELRALVQVIAQKADRVAITFTDTRHPDAKSRFNRLCTGLATRPVFVDDRATYRKRHARIELGTLAEFCRALVLLPSP